MTSLYCVEAFLPLLCALRENKTVKGMCPKADNIYTVERLLHILNNISEPIVAFVVIT